MIIKTLLIIIFLNVSVVLSQPLRIEINREVSATPNDVIYISSDRNTDEFIDYINKFKLGNLEPRNNCLENRIRSHESCFYINYEDNQLIFKNNNREINRNYTNFDILDIADTFYQMVLGIESSPFFDNYLISTYNSNSNRYEILRLDFNGGNVETLFSSPKSINSISVSPDNQKIAYVSFERYYPVLIVQNLETLERNVYGFDMKPINSVEWSSDSEIILSMNIESNYNLYSFNINNRRLITVLKDDNIDFISPVYNNDNIFITGVRGVAPSIYKYNVINKQLNILPISRNYSFSTDVDIDEQALAGIIRERGRYHLILYNNYENSASEKLFSNNILENINFLTGNHFFALTFQRNNVNNIGIINKNGEFLKSLSFPDRDILDLTVIKP